MNSGLMNVHHNDTENFIDKPDLFSILAADSYVNTNPPTFKQVTPRLAINNWM